MNYLYAINDILPCGICRFSMEENPVLLYGNQKFYDLIGYTDVEYEQKCGNLLYEIIKEQDLMILRQYLKGISEGEQKQFDIRITGKDCTGKWVNCICSCYTDESSVKSFFMSLQEKTGANIEADIKGQDDRLDAVTGVYNRDVCKRETDAILSANQNGEKYVFCLISILNFKAVNERYGNVMGDTILRRIGDEIQKTFQTAGVVGRTAGTEFGVLLKQYDRTEIVTVLGLLLERVRSIYVGEGDSLSLNAKMGLACVDEDDNYEQLYKRAHTALYRIQNDKWYQFDDEIERDIDKLETKEILVDTKSGEKKSEKEKETESFEKFLLSKKEFVARMSHEIRTPMNAICGMSDMLIQNGLTGLNLEYVNIIKAESDNLLSIVDDVLDVSGLEVGEVELELENYQIRGMLEDMKAFANSRLQKRNIIFLLQVNPMLPTTLCGDEKKIRQVLRKLLSNALKFTESGFVSLAVDFEETEEPDEIVLKFSVKDSGIGIKKEDVSKLFAEFVQVDTRKNRDVEGVGLGLSICKRLARYLDGTIQVESEYGTGSKFSFILKQKVKEKEPVFRNTGENGNRFLVFEKNRYEQNALKKLLESLSIQAEIVDDKQEFLKKAEDKKYSHVMFDYSKIFYDIRDLIGKNPEITYVGMIGKDTIRPTLSEEENSCYLYKPISVYSIKQMLYGDTYDASLQKFTAPDLKVLIVDDNPVNLKVAQGLISTYQCQIMTVSSGFEAVELLAERPEYDLLFLDYMMPQMDGIETLHMIRDNLGEYGRNVKAVALTANVVVEAQKEYRENGFQGFLAKPIDVKHMHELMELLVPENLKKAIDLGTVREQMRIGLSEHDLKRVAMKGIDTEAGIRSCGNKVEEYLKILKIVLLSGRTKVEELKKYAEEKNYEAYGIEAHAFKSVAASIGAFKQSELAREHEFAVKDKQYAIVDKGYLKLINSYKYLLSQIQGVLDKEENKTHNEVNKKAVDEIVWKNLIQDTIQAIGSFQQRKAKQLLEELQSCALPENVGQIVEKAAEKMKLYDDEAAEELLNSISLGE